MKDKLFLCAVITLSSLLVTCSESFINLGGKYRLTNTTSLRDLTLVDSNSIVVINGHILDFVVDSQYILVAQRPRDSVFFPRNARLEEQDKIFEESPFRQFWILNKITDSIYGPYSWNDFLKKRADLQVSRNLVLLRYGTRNYKGQRLPDTR
jgi:hypothetical protein